MKRIILVLAVAAVMATMLALAGPSFAARDNTNTSTINKQLTDVREATRKYQQLTVDPETSDPISGNALDDGYTPPEDNKTTLKPNCVKNQAGSAAMGYHYVNHEPPDDNLFFDGKLDPLKPEALLYIEDYTDEDPGKLKLTAVEYIVAEDDLGKLPSEQLIYDSDGVPVAPQLFGQRFNGPMPGHESWQPRHYDLHAWIWQDNPDGMFAQFNPDVHCPTS